MSEFDEITLLPAAREGDAYRFTLKPLSPITEEIQIRWEISFTGVWPAAPSDFETRMDTIDFFPNDGEREVVIRPNNDDVPEIPKTFDIRIYREVANAPDTLLKEQTVTLYDDDPRPGPSPTIRGDGEANILLGATTETLRHDGGEGDDAYIITRFQYGVMHIADSGASDSDTIRFDLDVAISEFSETPEGAAVVALRDGGEVRITNPDTYKYRFGGEAEMNYAAFKAALTDLTEALTITSVAALPVAQTPTDSAAVRHNAVGDTADNILSGEGDGGETLHMAGGRGGDTYIIGRFQRGDVKITDVTGSNMVQFDYGVTIVGFEEITMRGGTIKHTTKLELGTGAEVSILYPAKFFDYRLADGARLTYEEFKEEIGVREGGFAVPFSVGAGNHATTGITLDMAFVASGDPYLPELGVRVGEIDAVDADTYDVHQFVLSGADADLFVLRGNSGGDGYDLWFVGSEGEPHNGFKPLGATYDVHVTATDPAGSSFARDVAIIQNGIVLRTDDDMFFSGARLIEDGADGGGETIALGKFADISLPHTVEMIIGAHVFEIVPSPDAEVPPTLTLEIQDYVGATYKGQLLNFYPATPGRAIDVRFSVQNDIPGTGLLDTVPVSIFGEELVIKLKADAGATLGEVQTAIHDFYDAEIAAGRIAAADRILFDLPNDESRNTVIDTDIADIPFSNSEQVFFVSGKNTSDDTGITVRIGIGYTADTLAAALQEELAKFDPLIEVRVLKTDGTEIDYHPPVRTQDPPDRQTNVVRDGSQPETLVDHLPLRVDLDSEIPTFELATAADLQRLGDTEGIADNAQFEIVRDELRFKGNDISHPDDSYTLRLLVQPPSDNPLGIKEHIQNFVVKTTLPVLTLYDGDRFTHTIDLFDGLGRDASYETEILNHAGDKVFVDSTGRTPEGLRTTFNKITHVLSVKAPNEIGEGTYAEVRRFTIKIKATEGSDVRFWIADLHIDPAELRPLPPEWSAPSLFDDQGRVIGEGKIQIDLPENVQHDPDAHDPAADKDDPAAADDKFLFDLLRALEENNIDTSSLTFAFSTADGATIPDGFTIENEFLYYTGSPLDYEDPDAQRAYHFSIVVTDESGNSDIAKFIVRLTDVRETPVFISPRDVISLPEESLIASRVHTALAEIDLDLPIVYTLEGKDASAFRIDAATGIITLRKDLDFDAEPFYLVTIRATAGTGSDAVSTTHALRFNVIEAVDYAPAITFTSPETVEVENFVSHPAFVYQARVETDGTTADLPSYSLVYLPNTDNDDTGYFDINEATGILVFTGDPTASKTEYRLTVKATVGDHSALQDIVVTFPEHIVGIDEHPHTSPPLTEPVEVFTVPSPFTGEGAQYSFAKNGKQTKGKFHIDETTGVLSYTGSGFDYENRGHARQRELEIKVEQGEDSAVVPVVILLQDVDEDPLGTFTAPGAQTLTIRAGDTTPLYRTATGYTIESDVIDPEGGPVLHEVDDYRFRVVSDVLYAGKGRHFTEEDIGILKLTITATDLSGNEGHSVVVDFEILPEII